MPRSLAATLPPSVRIGGTHPLRFGTGRRWLQAWDNRRALGLSSDMRMFAATYAAGFLVVSLFIA